MEGVGKEQAMLSNSSPLPLTCMHTSTSSLSIESLSVSGLICARRLKTMLQHYILIFL